MANPSKSKGTSGETELRYMLLGAIPGLVRTPASSLVDLAAPGTGEPVNVLATRPDRGRWLVTTDLHTFCRLLTAAQQEDDPAPVNIEVKRYRRFSLHSIFEAKFGRK